MKIQRSPTDSTQGGVLMWTIFVVGAMGLVLFLYLNMVSTHNQLTWRSQTWNSCVAIAEAGIEEGLAHLNQNGMGVGANLASQGWIATSNGFYMNRTFGGGYYEVTIQTGSRPVITSTGRLPTPVQAASAGGPILAAAGGNGTTTYISRTIQVRCRAIGRFTKAIVAKNQVQLNGKNVFIDSYHSYDPAASTYNPSNPSQWGIYDSNKFRANGDVAVIDGFKDDLNIKSASVWGHVATGPDGDIKVDKNAIVGDVTWHSTGQKGVEPGWSTLDANFDMPDVVQPFNNGTKPVGGFVGTNYYDYILGNDDYSMSQLNGKVFVAGNARLLVTSKINFSTDPKNEEGIEIDDNARLEIYMKGKDATLVGKKNKKNQTPQRMGFNSGGSTTNFFYYGLKESSGNLVLQNMDEFDGMIYAPYAHIDLKGGNPKYYHCHFFGTVIGYDVTLEKNVSFHYDENMANLTADSFVVESWSEL